MTYSICEARRRFYLWAAYRAAQAGSVKATGKDFYHALKECGVIKYLEGQALSPVNAKTYDKKFHEWVKKLNKYLKSKSKHRKTVPYGVAAKLISIYAKGAFILNGYENSELARHIHPPIDSRLLKSLATDPRFTEEEQECLRETKWTRMTKGVYYRRIELLRKVLGGTPFWMLEEHWIPVDDEG